MTFTVRLLRDFQSCQRGNIAVISALALTGLVGIVGLATEYGNAVQYQVRGQRVADAAAYAAASAYSASSSASITSAAKAVAAKNGVAAANVAATLVTSPSGSGNQAVKVVVTTSAPLMLTRVIAPETMSLSVKSTAYAELAATTPGCVLALKSSGQGITLSGGAGLTAASCAVQSNNTVTVPCGTTITTIELDYNSTTAPSQPCSGITAPAGKTLKTQKQASTDPIAGTAVLTAATARIASVKTITSPSAPAAVTGTDYALKSSNSVSMTNGCTAARTGSTWTVTCSGAGPFNFGTLTLEGGTTTNFNTAGSASAVYNFTKIDMQGTTVTFGPGTYNIRQGLVTGGGTTTTFGAGTFNIGKLAAKCNNNQGGYGQSVCHQGTTLTFGGPSTFVTEGGVYVKGGSNISLGSGTTNSYYFGAADDGGAFRVDGGAIVYMADATTGLFKLAGNLSVPGGGSCTRIPASAYHDIKGSIDITGGLLLGSGLYTITGYFAAGAGSGGDVTCWGSTLGVSGTDVTLTIAGLTTYPSSTCATTLFCVGAGYAHVVINAPTTGSYAKLAVVGSTSVEYPGGAKFAQGASGTQISGAFYIPNGPITMNGAASTTSSQCLQLIGTQITLGGGATAATACISGSGASGGSGVVIVG